MNKDNRYWLAGVEVLLLIFLVAAALMTAKQTLQVTGHRIVSDWALVMLVAIPAVVIIVAIAAIFNRRVKLKGQASKNGGSGHMNLD